jgi:hypothetical protein
MENVLRRVRWPIDEIRNDPNGGALHSTADIELYAVRERIIQ